MSQEKENFKLKLLSDLCEEIVKYQGVSGSSESLFGIPYDFIENIEEDSVKMVLQPDWCYVTGRTSDYDFVIHKFSEIIKIEKHSKEYDVEITRFVDADFKVHTNSTITNYRVNKNPFSKKSVRGKGNAILVCDCNGNFISEEQFWDIWEDLEGNKSFKPYVQYKKLQAVGNEIVLGKSYKSYYDMNLHSNITYDKYIAINDLNSRKKLYSCGGLPKQIYYSLLEETGLLKTDENQLVKSKLK